MEEIKIFNIRINPLKISEFLEIIEANIRDGGKLIQNGVNAASINELVKNEELVHAYTNSDLINIDGMSLVWSLRFLGYSVPERVACPDLADILLERAAKNNFKVFLFGAKEKSVMLSKEYLMQKFPDLLIVGHRNGYYGERDELDIVNLINSKNPDILFIGMPSPCKELFIEKYRNHLTVKYILGVGGYFDILSGRIKRAPKWMQNIGLEWSYRLLQEPTRMFYRYVIGNFNFIWIILKEKFRRRNGSGGNIK
jgi:N-acetylglucosaminyldiphosphoundecaprenol N-acetyl-beta-D-mannosaminyltransferase